MENNIFKLIKTNNRNDEIQKMIGNHCLCCLSNGGVSLIFKDNSDRPFVWLTSQCCYIEYEQPCWFIRTKNSIYILEEVIPNCNLEYDLECCLDEQHYKLLKSL